ncbi:ROK family protein, partial [Lactobacillus reuteri]|nr:ROK family protein [Limosilactobacillus reuteri]
QKILIDEIKKQFMILQKSDYRLHDDVTMPEIMTAKFGNEANLLGALYGLLLTIE